MERDGGVFLPEWQGWRNGAAKCMDEGGEGGEGGGEKRERERGDPMRGEKRKCEEKKNQILRRRRGRCGQTRKSLFFWLTTLCVCLNCHFIIEHTHTHTHGDDYHTPYYGCTDNCLAPTGLPIHCNPSNTLNFHFKQKLNRQKTQGSILLPPLFFPPASCFLFFFVVASFLAFQPLVQPLLHLWNSISEW